MDALIFVLLVFAFVLGAMLALDNYIDGKVRRDIAMRKRSVDAPVAQRVQPVQAPRVNERRHACSFTESAFNDVAIQKKSFVHWHMVSAPKPKSAWWQFWK